MMSKHPFRLLIIDDEQDSIRLLISYFESQSFDILVALDGEDGCHKAVIGQPDLILLDVSMPGLDGFAVCSRLKDDVRTRQIPVVFLSGRIGLDDKLKGFTAGCVDYVTKPFSEAEVIARIQLHIGFKRRIESLETAMNQHLLERAGVEPDPEQSLFARAIQRLENFLAKPPGLIELAHELGTNERKLTLVFRRKTGMTVFEYLVDLRLESARRLLESSQLQIQLIAEQVGYLNPGDFTRAFRRRYGVTPKEYRRTQGVRDGDGL